MRSLYARFIATTVINNQDFAAVPIALVNNSTDGGFFVAGRDQNGKIKLWRTHFIHLS